MNETQPASDALIGAMLLGRYRVLRELAKGGMGVVYLARVEGAVGFVKPVVVKLLLPEHAGDERFLRMFAREAQIVSQLRHPSVVDVLEFAEQDGAHVMVLEYVSGHHLGQWSRYLQLSGRHIAVEIAIQITIDVLDALHHAHSLTHPDGTSMHIVHRDVSPSNILLDEDGRARLLDFGVARMRGGSTDYQTQVHGIVGKLTYTAPEIFEGNEASAQSDLYSCAVVLHEMLLGRNVFKGENQAETMQRAMHHTPESIASERADVPPGLDAVLGKALSKAPADRHATCREFCDALRELLPVSESEVHVAFSAMLKHDFRSEMAELLGIESLADREETWRKLGAPARKPSPSVELREEETDTRDHRPNRASTESRDDDGNTRARRSRSVSLRARGTLGGSMRAGRSSTLEEARKAMPDVAAANGEQPPAEAKPDEAGTPVQRIVPTQHEDQPVAAGGRREQLATIASTAGRQRTRRLLRRWPLALGSVALSILIGSALVFGGDPPPDPPAVVAASTPAQTTVGDLSRTVPALRNETPSPTPPDPRPDAKPRTRPAPAPRRNEPDPLRLTRAFREQQSKVEACFGQPALGLATPKEITVEFDLDLQGQLKRAQVMPRAFGRTPIGTCIERVAKATRFPKQGRAVSFTIPVHTSRGP